MFSAGASYGSDDAISSTICQLATWPGVAQCLDEPNPEVDLKAAWRRDDTSPALAAVVEQLTSLNTDSIV